MIIKGNSRGNAKFFAKHLLNAEENERVEVKEIEGFSIRSGNGQRDSFTQYRIPCVSQSRNQSVQS